MFEFPEGLIWGFIGTNSDAFGQGIWKVSTNEASLMAQAVKRLSTMWETRVRSLGWEDPLEKEMAIHSSTIAWKISWTEEPGTVHGVAKSRT